MLETVARHLHTTIWFMGFSSAINTVHTNTLLHCSWCDFKHRAHLRLLFIPILFSVYTNISCSSEVMTLLMNADDMALVAHLTGTDASVWIPSGSKQLGPDISGKLPGAQHHREIRRCAVAAERSQTDKGQLVEQVQSFKYLGTEIDTFLSFPQHTDSVPSSIFSSSWGSSRF